MIVRKSIYFELQLYPMQKTEQNPGVLDRELNTPVFTFCRKPLISEKDKPEMYVWITHLWENMPPCNSEDNIQSIVICIFSAGVGTCGWKHFVMFWKSESEPFDFPHSYKILQVFTHWGRRKR